MLVVEPAVAVVALELPLWILFARVPIPHSQALPTLEGAVLRVGFLTCIGSFACNAVELAIEELRR